MLYTQLLYFASLFDEHRIITASESSARKGSLMSTFSSIHPYQSHHDYSDEVIRTMEANLTLLNLLGATMSKHMERCGRRYVNLSNLFSFMAL